MIENLDNFPVPDYSNFLFNVPIGYHFTNLTVDNVRCPKTSAIKTYLFDIAERHYKYYQIVGNTYVNFLEQLQLSLDENIDTLERLIEVYNSDIAKPILGRTETVTYDLTNTGEVKQGESRTENIDNPVDDPEDLTPSNIVKTDNTGNKNENKQSGTVTTELSDLGTRPNYESLNGFLENNKTVAKFFIDIFKDNFKLGGGLLW